MARTTAISRSSSTPLNTDDAGRVVALTNPDVRIDFLDLNFDGQAENAPDPLQESHGAPEPAVTDILDVYEQTTLQQTSASVRATASRRLRLQASLAAPSCNTTHGNVKSIQLNDG